MRKALSQWEVVMTCCVLFGWSYGGITKVICSGRVWVEPAPVIQMGLNISVICQSTLQNCRPRKFHFYKNGERVQNRLQVAKINQTSARLWLSNFREPRVHLICTVQCPRHDRETLICGEDISSGYPPSVPANLTCLVYEHSDNIMCTWNTGTPTYINTNYTVHVKSLITGEEQLYLASRYISISANTLQGGKTYSIWVRATNALGMEESDHLQVNLDDIVIPALPIITSAEDINTTVPKTIIHWKSQTLMDGVFCEMRHKAITSPSWKESLVAVSSLDKYDSIPLALGTKLFKLRTSRSITRASFSALTFKEMEANLTSMKHTEYNLEPNTKYEFQGRCRRSGGRYLDEWSVPFFHTTPEGVPQVSLKSFQDEHHHILPLNASFFKDHLTSGHGNSTIGLWSGMILCAIVLSILFLTVIFKQSLRIRIKRRLLLFLPNWLHEDVPNVRNSYVMKTLQEISEFVMNSSSEPFINLDPKITEIEEIFLSKELQPIDSQMEETTELMEITSPLVDMTVIYLPDPGTGYKPQISNFLPLENPPSEISDLRESALETQASSLGLGKNVVIRNCPSPVFTSSNMDAGKGFFSLEEIGLIFDHSECGPSPLEGLMETEKEVMMPLEEQSSRESLLEQTLLPEDLTLCLRATVEEETPNTRPYFPQILRPFS